MKHASQLVLLALFFQIVSCSDKQSNQCPENAQCIDSSNEIGCSCECIVGHQSPDPNNITCTPFECSGLTCQGPGLTGSTEPNATLSGECICETSEGYFYHADAKSAQPCDADGDGWTRINAKSAIESEDPVISANARCIVRQIQNITFYPDNGSSPQTTEIPTRLPLYETERNDFDLLLRSENFPSFGARPLRAAELNSFTKVCHTLDGDYNDNDIFDIDETQVIDNSHPLGEYRPYSYFIELHRGWYENGTYHIVERARNGNQELNLQFPLRYIEGSSINNADGSNYWRQCVRKADSLAINTQPTITNDFSTHNSDFLHHSQFKCLKILPASISRDDPIFQNPPQNIVGQHQIDNFFFREQAPYRINICGLSSTSNPNVSFGAIDIDCEALRRLPDGASVIWGAVRYNQSIEPQRGCIDECRQRLLLPQQNNVCALSSNTINSEPGNCVGSKENFGQLACGCSNGLLCECIAGETRECGSSSVGACQLGVQTCLSTYTWGPCEGAIEPQEEICLEGSPDEDCDGLANLSDEDCNGCTIGQTRPCGTNVGLCQQGIETCRNGTWSSCEGNIAPQPQELCDNQGNDEDCNGVSGKDDGCNCLVGETRSCQHSISCGDGIETCDIDGNWSSCQQTIDNRLTWYEDADRDGYSPNTNQVLACTQPASVFRESNSIDTSRLDTCDTDGRVRPGSNTYYNFTNRCENYDFDSNGTEDQLYTQVGFTTNQGNNIQVGAEGWVTQQSNGTVSSGPIAACGQRGTWLQESSSGEPRFITRLQLCR